MNRTDITIDAHYLKLVRYIGIWVYILLNSLFVASVVLVMESHLCLSNEHWFCLFVEPLQLSYGAIT